MNKKLWWAVGIVVVVLAVWAVMSKSGVAPDLYNSPSPSVSAGATVTPTPPVTSGIGTGAAYTALVAKYGSNRIQFDARCQANPPVVSFKTGTYVMFDNRSGDARTISIGGTKYYFPGYGWRVIKLGSTKLPATVTLNCGTAVNVGTITVSK